MSISIEETEKIAKLAMLEVTNEEKEKFRGELNDILKYIEKLNQLDTRDILPTAQILNLNNVFREDINEKSLPVEKVMSIAPEHEKGCFKVPKIIE
ncbi:MAG: Asp-tRNA(Asn)/Glu-tRNA(Gln) amidotransferase subunit GatC [Candidatus Firestonebacteria bacterium]|nr:Asp-tRNA(Asn)/Glu-tRNA(Gln) amidotransferase subunit GatC [Candidatus Firestonebacteria bacterium]